MLPPLRLVSEAAELAAHRHSGMAPMRREVAEAKLMALGAGARLARQRAG